MKYLIFLLLSFMSCNLNRSMVESESLNEFEIVEISIVNDEKKIVLNELRIYHPNSANDASCMMNNEFGEWNQKRHGKHQDNIHQFVWHNVSLNDSIPSLTIITDGAETLSEYFTSFVILDSKTTDCLNPAYKYHDQLVKFIFMKTKKLKSKNCQYPLYK